MKLVASQRTGRRKPVAIGNDFAFVHIRQYNRAGQLAGLVGRKAEDHDLRRKTGKHLTPEVHAAAFVGDGLHRAFEIKRAPVIGDRAVFQRHEHIAERLIRTGVMLVADPQAFLIELNVLLRCAAKHHRAEPAIADGQRCFSQSVAGCS